MKKSVWIERLPGGYSVRYWQETAPGVSRQQREWFADYNLAQKFAANKRLQLLAKQQGITDPTLNPLNLFEIYLRSLTYTHRPATIEIKEGALRHFLETTPKLNRSIIENWKEKMLQDLHINTVAIRLRELRAFCNWCIKENYLTENPFLGMKVPKEVEVGRKLEIDELQRILAASDPRFRLFLLFLTYQGGRRNETLKTRWVDIDFAKGTWTIPAPHAKSKRERIVPLAPPVLVELKSMHQEGTGPFIGLAEATIHYFLKKALKAAGIVGRVRPHDFRHTFCSHWSGDPRILMDMVGWTSLTMLNRYSHFHTENIRQEAGLHGIGAKLEQLPSTTSINGDLV